MGSATYEFISAEAAERWPYEGRQPGCSPRASCRGPMRRRRFVRGPVAPVHSRCGGRGRANFGSSAAATRHAICGPGPARRTDRFGGTVVQAGIPDSPAPAPTASLTGTRPFQRIGRAALRACESAFNVSHEGRVPASAAHSSSAPACAALIVDRSTAPAVQDSSFRARSAGNPVPHENAATRAVGRQ